MSTGALSRPELRPLVDALAARFGAGDAPVRVTVRGLPLPTQHAVADLLGTDRLPGSVVRVERLVAALRLGSVAELRAAVEAVRGPLPDRRADRAAQRAARAELWDWLAGQAGTVSLGGLDRWYAAQRALGVRGGVAAHRRRLESALAVLRTLPADGVPLAALAADQAGDPHALDHGRLLAGIVLDAIARVLDLPPPIDAESVRTLWESVGVVPDPLSSTVLALGVSGAPDTPLGRWLAEAAECGEPVVLTLASVRRWPLPPLPRGVPAYVVENPSLVAAAVAGGWSGPPLICSAGRPTIAVVTLLRQLGAAGAVRYQHADFDPAGLAITAWLAERAGTVPWRMGGGDYLAALAAVRRGLARPRLDVPIPATPWDPALGAALARERVPIYEEDVRVALLDAMRQPAG